MLRPYKQIYIIFQTTLAILYIPAHVDPSFLFKLAQDSCMLTQGSKQEDKGGLTT